MRRNEGAGEAEFARQADRFAALGSAARLRIVRLLLAAHPTGMVAGEIQAELGIPASTLSHHLEKLRHEGLVRARRQRNYLWYSAESEALRGLLELLYAECCTRSARDGKRRPAKVCLGKERGRK